MINGVGEGGINQDNINETNKKKTTRIPSFSLKSQEGQRAAASGSWCGLHFKPRGLWHNQSFTQPHFLLFKHRKVKG